MRRRYLVRAVAVMAAAWPLVAGAQQAVMPVIGLLSGGSSEPFAAASASFEDGLNEAGFIPGKNVALEYRWAQGRSDRLPGLAADLVSRQVALIVTATLPGALAAKAASTTIPIVFVIGEEPVQVGLVASLNRPGGNITGVSNFMNLLAPKRLQLLAETVPKATMLALLVNARNPNAEPDTRDLQAAARALGRGLQVLTASTDQELVTAFTAIAQQRLGGLSVNIDSFFGSRTQQIVELAARHAVPAIYPLRQFVTAGGLMSYDADYAEAWHQAGAYAGRILKGSKPADLPVIQAAKFRLVINLKTAEGLGLEIPPRLLTLADEVIE